MGISIDPATASQATGGLASPNTTSATKNEFMTLFVAQLKNQNPLSPQDPSAFVAQLAQLSQLEQAAETNQRLDALADQQAAGVRANLSALVGREVVAATGAFAILPSAEPPPDLRVTLAAPASAITIKVLDAGGRTVRTIDAGPGAAGDLVVPGAELAGLNPGSYSLAVEAKNAAGASITSSVSFAGTATALELGPDGGRFRLGNVSVTPGSIISVGALAPSEEK
jgi:flagellar basal-body rod modification protein FlgD